MWISKKEYEDIMFKLNAADEQISNWQRKYDECQRKYDEAHLFLRVEIANKTRFKCQYLERSSKTQKEQIGSLQKELDRYKKSYLDELQKRLELASRVRELEGE